MQKKSRLSVSLDRVLCLAAIAVIGYADYGLRVPLLCAVGAVTAMLTELVCLYLRKIPFGKRHLDAAVHGVILVMLLPPTVPFSLLIISEIAAIIIGRGVFGGGENPMLPPAAVGYCIALLSDRAAVTMFPARKGVLPILDIDTASLTEGISGSWNKDGIFSQHIDEWLLGLPAQPIGTCSIVLLTVIAAVLLMRRSASGFVLLPMLSFLLIGGCLYQRLRNPAAAITGTCLTNQTLFAAIFLYADPDIAPPHVGGMLFGLFSGIAVLWFTREIPVYDAPVMLAVILNPAAVLLKDMLEKEAARKQKGGAADAERTGGSIPAAEKPHSA